MHEVMNPNIHREEKRTIPANTYNSSEYLTMKGKSDLQLSSELSEEEDNMYETVSSSVLEAIHSLRILPAKPLQESEYADTRCLRPSGTTSPASESPSQPPQHSAIHTFDSERRTMPNVRGGRMKIHGYQEPTPPPRPLKMLPKQYQPLPPEPRISSQVLHKRNTLSRDPTVPTPAEVTRHSSVKESNKAPGREQATSLGKKPEVPFQAHHHPPEASPQCTWSSKNICRSGSTLSVDNLTMKKPPPPTSYAACKNKSKHLLVEQEMQSLTKPTEKDLNKCEWYVGEYDRHRAEKILLQRNTDETFLVRDCSKKSKAEPYVLVVYYGRRVYNIKVRFLEESQQYALGTGLRGECPCKVIRREKATDTFSILTTAFADTFHLQSVRHSSHTISLHSFPCEPKGLAAPTFSSHQTGLTHPSRLGSTSTMPPSDSVMSTVTARKRGTTNSQYLQLRDVYKKFNSVEEIIDFYKSVPITLIDGKDQSGNHREQCYLTHPFKAC